MAQTIGYYQFCANALHTGRENLLDLYACLHQTESWKPGTKVTLNAPALRLLTHYWTAPPPSDQGRAWGPQEKVRVLQISISTDASGVAWGAHVHSKWDATQTHGNIPLPAANSVPNADRNMRGQFHTDETSQPIHILEYEAVYRALKALTPHIRDSCVRIWCDNQVVVHGLKKGFSAKPAILQQIKRIHELLRQHHASIIIQWISTKDNIPADTLSRENLGDAFQLNPITFRDIDMAVGGCTVDRFATAMNTLLPTFNSYFKEDNCAGVDAFAQTDWQHHTNYCNPPFSQIARLVKFIRTFEPRLPRCVIIAPCWKQQAWYQQLCAVADHRHLLPQHTLLFVRLHDHNPRAHYLHNQHWRMEVFFININLTAPLLFSSLSSTER